MKALIPLIVSLVVLAVPLAAQQFTPDKAALQALRSARSFRCSFPQYATVDWDRDQPQLQTGTEDDFILQIDGVDYSTGDARMIGNVGASDLVVVSGVTTVSFVERIPSGEVNLTTVYAWRDSMGLRFKAVHSRHTAIFGPSPSQYFGYCEVWQ